uniref:Uncharacterized protein n=1 Tax=Oncorhynchus mykiss TaxID=8022 RepID=A0A8C7U380_ONCMY
ILRATEMYSNACLWLFRICSPLSCLHTLFACSSAARCLGLATIARDIRSHSQAKSTPKFKTRTRSTVNNGKRGGARALLSYQRKYVTANKSLRRDHPHCVNTNNKHGGR